MRTRRVFRGDQQEEELRQAAVERLEIDSRAAAAEGRDDSGELRHLAVRDRDALTDRRGAELFALEQHVDEALLRDGGMALGERRRELLEDGELRGPFEVGDDVFEGEDVEDLHGPSLASESIKP